ncbi:Lrp/AsnC ligand binding domain-containing protein [Mesorhizobium caraganae]|uniref:Lrp/AsnC ligand binding domain-containing protein n=1 Tax=Mesorhizobium caraganae TaxID=483206 RepID=UPI00289C006A|nr:Lrp/AsnC ligand binding domain-containing protein [Mesorhizobium caraganae]
MSVKLERQINSALVAFETEIMKHPEVIDCWLMTGDNNYLLRVLTPGLKEYEIFLTGTLTKVPGIASIQSSVSLRRVKSSASGIVQRIPDPSARASLSAYQCRGASPLRQAAPP